MKNALRPADFPRRGDPIFLKYRPRGSDAEVDAVAFADYLRTEVAALRQTANALADEPVKVHYLITSIKKESPTSLELTPVVKMVQVPLMRRVHHEHVRIIGDLERGVVPTTVDFATLETYQKLGDIAKRNR